MTTKILTLLTAACCFLSQWTIANETDNAEAKKEPRALILIIATDDKPAYRQLQKVWESYMNSDPKHFEAYFIRADANLPTEHVIKKNEIIVKTQEGFAPGILNKSIMAINAMLPRLKEFDFVIRTNLSSLYVYPNLVRFLSNLPRENCYCGGTLYQTRALGLPPDLNIVPFVTGAGIYMSTDMAELLAKGDPSLEKYKNEMADDVFIGLFFEKKKIPPIGAQRWDYPTRQGWLDNKDKIPDHAYHFRAKFSYNLRTHEDPFVEELQTNKELLKKYYNITLETEEEPNATTKAQGK